ncbi:MAG: hypothetical protein NTX79_05600 [Candidatus Micrarchaeota archaeon]|nr:hypothetical protein [Candidatus Micrarchaeota archaeon]
MPITHVPQTNPRQNLSPEERKKETFKKYVYPDLKNIPTLAVLNYRFVESYLYLNYDREKRTFSNSIVSNGTKTACKASFNASEENYWLNEKSPRSIRVLLTREPWKELTFTPDALDIIDLKSGKWFAKGEHLFIFRSIHDQHKSPGEYQGFLLSIKKDAVNILPMLAQNDIYLEPDQMEIAKNAWKILLGEHIAFTDKQGREYTLELPKGDGSHYFDILVVRKELPDAHRQNIEWALANFFDGISKESQTANETHETKIKTGIFSLLQFSSGQDAVYLLAGHLRDQYSDKYWTLDPYYKERDQHVGSSAARLATDINTMVFLVSTSYEMNAYVNETAKFLHDDAGVLNVLPSPAIHGERKENRKTSTSKVNKLLVRKNTELEAAKQALSGEVRELRDKIEIYRATVRAAEEKHALATNALTSLAGTKDDLSKAGRFGKRKAINKAVEDFEKALEDFNSAKK